jgi:hypothetical protein
VREARCLTVEDPRYPITDAARPDVWKMTMRRVAHTASLVAAAGLASAACRSPKGNRESRTTMTNPASSATPAEFVAMTARAMTDLPDGTTDQPTHQDLPGVPDIYSVSVDSARLRRNAFLQIIDGRVSVPAGLAEAGRRLASIRALDKQDWGGGLIYVVGALGGLAPGWPDVLVARETPGARGGARVTLRVSEPWVRYAAAGGVGPAPRHPAITGGGEAPPLPEGTVTLELGADYSLRWSYAVGDRDLGHCEAAAAGEPPALSGGELLDALEGARRRARAPRAVPIGAPRVHAAAKATGIVVVELCALGPVYVDLGQAAAPADQRLAAVGAELTTTPPATLLPLLQAVGALPPGLLVSQVLPSARIAAGELVADVPALVVEWIAGDGKQPWPLALRPGADPSRRGRVRLPLRWPLRWQLEVEAGAGTWRPAGAD